ncbi:MAG: hypothetical protein GY927_14725 [bacterium]|nr:hypothetical protein [bacterium]
MPQLLILAAIGASAYFGGKWISKKIRKFTANMEKATKTAKACAKQKPDNFSRQDAQELKKDPKTGVYHVDDD